MAAVDGVRTKGKPVSSSSTLASSQTLRFRFVGLGCTACARIVEKKLDKKKGVKRVGVSLMTDSVIVEINPLEVSEGEIEAAIRRTGYKVVRVDSSFQ